MLQSRSLQSIQLNEVFTITDKKNIHFRRLMDGIDSSLEYHSL
jgi:hypothetical protein